MSQFQRRSVLGGMFRFYERFIPIADRLYDEHIEALRREGSPP